MNIKQAAARWIAAHGFDKHGVAVWLKGLGGKGGKSEARDDALNVDALARIAESVEGAVLTSYSGPGMFGAQCVAIVCKRDRVHFVVEEAALAGMRGSKREQLGNKMVVYWPRYPSNLYHAERAKRHAGSFTVETERKHP